MAFKNAVLPVAEHVVVFASSAADDQTQADDNVGGML